MKWATFRTAENPVADRVGVLVDEKIYAVRSGVRLIDLIKDGQNALLTIGEEAIRAPASTHEICGPLFPIRPR